MSDPKPPPAAGAARPRGAARAPASPGPAQVPADAAAFDAWLRHHLAEMHAEVMLAPPPARFLAALGLRPRSGD